MISLLEPLLLLIPFILWIFCFLNFFTGRIDLQADAVSYADHIRFYIENLSRGVYPLWDPLWSSGASNDFFLRRIGDVNPFLLLLVPFKWLGVQPSSAYLIFLGGYYFLAGWAFYLIARLLLQERFFAFTAYILFLFSSWGSEIFYNYIIIIFVPVIWFFYFLLCFSRDAQKAPFLGMCFCLGLILTTYIPFFFLTILAIFVFLYILFYGRGLVGFLKRSFIFFGKNKIFSAFCIFFLLVSCVPGLLFYKGSKSGEFVLPNRHFGASSSSAVAVSLENVVSGDMISHGYFDRLFDDHAHLDMGDIYFPYVFFLLLLTAICARVNKLIFFLLFNMLAVSLITVTSASGVYHFLYLHIPFFKFIRQVYYFFWLAILPFVLLLAATAFKSLLEAIARSSRKTSWLIFIIACHLLFIWFLLGRQGVLGGAWLAVGLSLLYFLVCFFYKGKNSMMAGFCLLLLAVFIQSAQVYGFLEKKLIEGEKAAKKAMDIRKGMAGQYYKQLKMDLYYDSNYFALLVNYIDPDVLNDYTNHKFIFYDNVLPYKESREFFQTLQGAFEKHMNVVFLSAFDSKPDDWTKFFNTSGQPDLDPVHSGQLSVLYADANTWVLKAHLFNSRFLAVNDNYSQHWHAFINGRQARIFRANFSFKGLWVPAGESRIVLRFSTPGRYAFHISLLAVFVFVFLYLLVLLRRGAKWQA